MTFYTQQGYQGASNPGYVLSSQASTINPLPADWVLLPGVPSSALLPGVSSNTSPRLVYNLANHQYLQGSNNKKTANFIGNYEILPDVTAIAEAYFTIRNSGEQLDPEPAGYNITTLKYGGLVIPKILPDGSVNPYVPSEFTSNITNALTRVSNVRRAFTRTT